MSLQSGLSLGRKPCAIAPGHCTPIRRVRVCTAALPAQRQDGGHDPHGERCTSAGCLPRRQQLLALTAAVLLAPGGATAAGPAPADTAASEAGAAGGGGLQPYSNARQGYSLAVPGGWERKDKAGADVLFEDPGKRSTSVGVTVSPVRVRTLADFGSLEDIGQKLLDAERKKESTLSLELVQQAARAGGAGATLYEYEYEIDTTRGRKRILNSVTIFGGRLYILNGQTKCDKEAGCAGDEAAVAAAATLRRVAASFDVDAAGA